ncbi:hypothetical protein B0A55_04508 [Friedmanniomyces simplex]|uniref:Uncharacterized protein n=1 Tax=Friedmanniomyces simplex TaxID=329884 RepID=A0A4U0XQ21_9PEZI|nr:hypothetical protein B0A55_04508 [Friedmanniomyces simplex]
MLTLFMNAVPEMASEKEHKKVAESKLKRAMQYMPMLSPAEMLGGNFAARVHTQMVMMMDASGLVRDVDKYFGMYMQEHRFDLFPAFLQMTVKESHTIIEKWPLRIKMLPGEEGAKEEFKTLLSSSHTGIERYVKWRIM